MEDEKLNPAPRKEDKEKPKNLYRRKSDNKLYALQIVEDKPPFLGRTHVANSATLEHWAGTKEQFVREFLLDGQTEKQADPQPSSVKIPPK